MFSVYFFGYDRVWVGALGGGSVVKKNGVALAISTLWTGRRDGGWWLGVSRRHTVRAAAIACREAGVLLRVRSAPSKRPLVAAWNWGRPLPMEIASPRNSKRTQTRGKTSPNKVTVEEKFRTPTPATLLAKKYKKTSANEIA